MGSANHTESSSYGTGGRSERLGGTTEWLEMGVGGPCGTKAE